MESCWNISRDRKLDRNALFEARKRINYEISTQLRSHRVSKPNLLRNIDFTLTLFTLSLHIDSSRVPTRIHIYTIRTRR